MRGVWPVAVGRFGGAMRAARSSASAVVLGVACALTVMAQQASTLPSATTSSPDPSAALRGTALVAALREGGYVIYFRHTATDFSKNDAAMTAFDDCANQRPLNEQGRHDATAIGAARRSLGVPVGEAVASPMCRTMEHARLMLGQVEASHAVREGQAGDYPGLKRLLAAPVAKGSNRWIVGHGTPFRTVAGPPQLAEGEAVVIAPRATGWTVVARIAVADWPALVAAK